MISQQWDMVIGGKTVYVVYATGESQARVQITAATAGVIGHWKDYALWRRDGSPVRRMGTITVLREVGHA